MSKIPMPPSFNEVRTVLVDLLQGRLTREEADAWAGQWVYADDSQVKDMVIWQTLLRLAGCDLLNIDGSYLHGEENFRNWLDELDSRTPNVLR